MYPYQMSNFTSGALAPANIGMGPGSDGPPPPKRPYHSPNKGCGRGRGKRSRTGCFECRKRKVKCSEEKPTCARCEANSKVCCYPEHSIAHRARPPRGIAPDKSTSSAPTVPAPAQDNKYTASVKQYLAPYQKYPSVVQSTPGKLDNHHTVGEMASSKTDRRTTDQNQDLSQITMQEYQAQLMQAIEDADFRGPTNYIPPSINTTASHGHPTQNGYSGPAYNFTQAGFTGASEWNQMSYNQWHTVWGVGPQCSYPTSGNATVHNAPADAGFAHFDDSNGHESDADAEGDLDDDMTHKYITLDGATYAACAPVSTDYHQTAMPYFEYADNTASASTGASHNDEATPPAIPPPVGAVASLDGASFHFVPKNNHSDVVASMSDAENDDAPLQDPFEASPVRSGAATPNSDVNIAGDTFIATAYDTP
ncbi:hypothetical protein BDY21DRAFT_364513 [Lineolata rhizophorae]|uniref:Zn(2)-C6 fungal-type domain-containing protein n=1 Tax=Lineolata rhizophorae TaxID=578093 RepID=A0A6A6NZ09_9PEZI|nr:hypothetical protein BDY21DRAFT_364513 [Lineolata rhizophorae]